MMQAGRIRSRLHIGMSLAPTWLSGEAWRRPDSAIEGLFGADFYLDIARRAESARLDFVFLPDVMAVNRRLLGGGTGFASLDPTVLLAALARETTRIGLLTTASTTFFPPYVLARQILSLHWLSNGRAGWNIVTALDGHANFGLSGMPPAEERYARAAEFTALVRALWESYPESALLMDRAGGRFTDPDRIRPLNHKGRFFEVDGPLNLPSFSGARIPLVQAGASEAGRDFAASVADAIFASTPDRQAAIDLRRDLQARAVRQGRAAGDIRLLPGLSLYLAASRAEARDLFQATHAASETARKLETIREMTGLDLTDWPEERAITAADLPPPPAQPRSRTHSDLLRRLIVKDEPTLAELLRSPEVGGSAHWQIVGTVEDAMLAIADWRDAGAIDGFILVPGGSVDCMRLSLDGLVPLLVARGLARGDYAGATFIDHLTDGALV